MSSNETSFNAASIAEGNVIWFNSAIHVDGLGASPARIFLTDSTISFTANGARYNLTVPAATITFDPAARAASTNFDVSSNQWVTTVPSGLASRAFLTGLAFPVPAGGLPGGVSGVSWSAAFSTDTPGVTAKWQWAAAAYSNFGPDYNSLAVNPVDGQASRSGGIAARQKSRIEPARSDLAGQPANLEAFLTGGGSGDGGSNFTGSFGAASAVTPCAAGASGQPMETSRTTTM